MPNNGTIVGSASFVAAATGFGQAISLNGSGQYVSLPAGALPPAGSSFAIRFRAAFTAAGTMVALGATGSGASWWAGFNAGKFSWNVGNFNLTASAATNDGAWHDYEIDCLHTNGQSPPDGFVIYVDGTAVSASYTTFANPTSPAFSVGRFGGTAGYDFNGLIDELAIYNGSLRTSSFPSFTPPTAPTSNTAANLIALYHLDGNATDSASAAPTTTTIAVTDANWLHTPFNTYGDGTGAFGANNIPGGSTIQAIVATGGTPDSVTLSSTGNITLGVDVSRLVSASVAAGNYPIVSTSLDHGQWVDNQLTPTSTGIVVLSSGTVAQHTLQYVYKAGYCPATGSGPSKWTPAGTPPVPPWAIAVTGLTVDAGCTTVGQAAPAGGIDLVHGDSITEGLRAINASDAVTGNDGLDNYPSIIASTYNSQLGQLGYGATGYEQAGQSGVPGFGSSSGLYFSGASRLDANGHYQPQPTRIWIAHGSNGTTTQSDVATAITTARSRAPSARINVCVPPGGFARAAITAAVAACGDSNVKLIDAGTTFQLQLDGSTFPTATNKASDGLHPLVPTHGKYGALLVMLAADPGPSNVRSGLSYGSGEVGTLAVSGGGSGSKIVNNGAGVFANG